MRRFFNPEIITTGLAIFSMFFGAGNLMFPLRVGLVAGNANPWGIFGFLMTAILLPLAGLISIILFQGDYQQFFYRLGKIPGFAYIVFCTTIVGPLIAMPRITTLSYTVLQPFMPSFVNLVIFTIVFLFLTFLATYKESKIVDILGNVISPLLLISLIIIIVKGIITANAVTTTQQSARDMFWKNLVYGYQTLDLLGGIFFSAIVITILRKNFADPGKPDFKKFALISLKAGLIGVGLLGLIYIGLSHLGAYFGHGLLHLDEGKLFSTISFKILGTHGAAIIAIAVLMACYSTIIALTAVYAEFLNTQLCNNKLGYVPAVAITLLLTMIPAFFGLESILMFSKPIIETVYPSLIVLTLLNIAYKLFDFKPIKLPVALSLLIPAVYYLYTIDWWQLIL